MAFLIVCMGLFTGDWRIETDATVVVRDGNNTKKEEVRQEILATEKRVYVKNLVRRGDNYFPGNEFVFDFENGKVYTALSFSKEYFVFEMDLLKYMWTRRVEWWRKKLEQEKAFVMRIPDPGRRLNEEAKWAERWKKIEKFLKSSEPKKVETKREKVDGKIDGHEVEKVSITADGRKVIEALVAKDVKVPEKFCKALAAMSNAPRKVQAAIAALGGLPLRYSQKTVVGTTVETKKFSVRSVKEEKFDEKALSLPADYSEVKDAPYVKTLKDLARREKASGGGKKENGKDEKPDGAGGREEPSKAPNEEPRVK